MTTHSRVILCLLCAAATVAPGRPARAADPPCLSPAVESDASVLSVAPDLPGRIRARLEGGEGIDGCARVRLGTASGPLAASRAIRVEVTLRDGRSAARSVDRSEDVIPVVEALLLVPRSEVPSPDADAPAARRSSAAERAAVHPAPALRGFGLELSVVAGGRVGIDRTSLGIGVLSLMELSGWLAGFEGRGNRYDGGSEAAQAVLQLGAVGGHRFRFESVGLDLLAGPVLALQGQFATETTGPAGTTAETSSPVEPRLLFASHLRFAPLATWSGFAGVEAEIGLGGADASDVRRGSADAAPLPAWMLGVALGATVGTR